MVKKGAMELSIGTIVIIVLALSMLILGLVLVRTIMCGAVGLTSDLNSRVRGEVSKLFEATGGEVQCIGNSQEPVTMVPGKTNIIYCGIRAETSAKYFITVEDIKTTTRGTLTTSVLKNWLGNELEWSGSVAPGDELPKKIARLDIPDDAPETGIVIQVKIRKEGSDSVTSQDLDFRITRQGLIKAAVC